MTHSPYREGRAMTPATDSPTIAVIGAGSWGTALASLLAERHPQITLWAREPEVATNINQTHHNPLFLSDLPLPTNVIADNNLNRVATTHSVLVMVVPAQFTESVLHQVWNLRTQETIFVSASKGILVDRLCLLTDLYRETMGQKEFHQRFACLSGPSFAREVMTSQPTAVAVASPNQALAEQVQQLFHTPWFRTYRSDDVVGVELGGAVKNVIALAAGISDGLGFGHNARAALITRGLAEISRLGVALGARPETFAGLSGLGDLVLTATSDLSRNRTVGRRLGAGESLATILSQTREVAEGVPTALSTHRLALSLGVEMPITREVYEILHENKPVREAVTGLMMRELKAE